MAARQQDALERHLTPVAREWRSRRVALARRLSDTERVSVDLMQWQLEILVEGESSIGAAPRMASCVCSVT